MNTKKIKLLTIITIILTSIFSPIFSMENQNTYCLNIGDGVCTEGGHLRFVFDEKYDGNDFKIKSKQQNNMIELFEENDTPIFIINGHAYPPCLKGLYYLEGQDLYDAKSCNRVIPLRADYTQWNY